MIKETLSKSCPNLIMLSAVLQEDSLESLKQEELFVTCAKDNFGSNPFTGKDSNLELAFISMSELSREPLLFGDFFKRKNPTFYNSVLDNKILILLRTSPAERLLTFVNSL